MAFDAGMTVSVCRELDIILKDAKIEKIFQPSRDEIILACRAGGKSVKLMISASAACPRIGLTETRRENPQVPPMFCMQLRKYLTGGIIRSVRAPDFERVALIEIEARDEMNFTCRRYLICEIMGKCSNIILATDKLPGTDGAMKISGVLRTVDITTSRKRQVLAGMTYEAPPAQEGKISPFDETPEGFLEKTVRFPEESCDKFYLSHYSGISPLLSRELSFKAGAGDVPVYTADREKLLSVFEDFRTRLSRGECVPVMVKKPDGTPFEYAFFDVGQYGSAAVTERYDTLSALLDAFFGEKEKKQSVCQRSHDITQILTSASHKLSKKKDILEKELSDTEDAGKYKLWGDLITASAYMLTKKTDRAKVRNYYSDTLEEVEVPLDIRLTPMQNAGKYYKKYNKLKTASVILKEQLDSVIRDEAYLGTVREALDRAETEGDIAEIRRELSESGYSPKNRAEARQKPAPLSPMRFTCPGGYEIICGKNNLQNDYITFRLAKKTDWWFHVKNAHGAHAVLVTRDGTEPEAEAFTRAASIAAYYSSQKDSYNVAVDYTLVKNLKKPPSSKPGYVTYSSNYTAYVTPEKP